MNINTTKLSNAADWHATMALKAYRKRLYGDYRRHIRICDKLRDFHGTMSICAIRS